MKLIKNRIRKTISPVQDLRTLFMVVDSLSKGDENIEELYLKINPNNCVYERLDLYGNITYIKEKKHKHKLNDALKNCIIFNWIERKGKKYELTTNGRKMHKLFESLRAEDLEENNEKIENEQLRNVVFKDIFTNVGIFRRLILYSYFYSEDSEKIKNLIKNCGLNEVNSRILIKWGEQLQLIKRIDRDTIILTDKRMNIVEDLINKFQKGGYIFPEHLILTIWKYYEKKNMNYVIIPEAIRYISKKMDIEKSDVINLLFDLNNVFPEYLAMNKTFSFIHKNAVKGPDGVYYYIRMRKPFVRSGLRGKKNKLIYVIQRRIKEW